MEKTADSVSVGAGLTLESAIPLRWSAAEDADAVQIAGLQQANEELLRVISILDEHAPQLTDEHPAVAHELQRLDFKLNVLLDLVGQLFARSTPLPPAVPARLNAESVEWEATHVPARGSRVYLEIYLNAQYPRPLILTGQVSAIQPMPNAFHILVIFDDMSEIVRDWLEKIIFRRHRRQIAHTRRGSP